MTGGQTGVLAEGTVEIRGVVKTALQSNFQNGVLMTVVQQKSNGLFQPQGHDVIPQGYAEAILKQGRQIGRRHMYGVRYIG